MTHDFGLTTACQAGRLLVLGVNFRERPIMCFYIYRRKTPEKVTAIFENFPKKIEKKLSFALRNRPGRSDGG